MRTFVLNRTEDETGISGTGIVAEGVQFDNGKVVVAWKTSNGVHSVTVFNHVDEVERIHGHGGKTRVVWSEMAEGLTGCYTCGGYVLAPHLEEGHARPIADVARTARTI